MGSWVNKSFTFHYVATLMIEVDWKTATVCLNECVLCVSSIVWRLQKDLFCFALIRLMQHRAVSFSNR